MHVEIHEGVKDWIRSKGNQLTVQLLEVKGCCAPDIEGLVVLPRKPKNVQNYREFTIDDLSVYVQTPIAMKEKLVLQLKGFGILKTVTAKVQ